MQKPKHRLKLLYHGISQFQIGNTSLFYSFIQRMCIF